MKTHAFILILFTLAGCSGTRVECELDAGAAVADADASDTCVHYDESGNPVRAGYWTGRSACTLMGTAYQAGLADPGRFRGCPQVACPVDYDTSGRVETLCEPEALERCLLELGVANGCDAYNEVMASACAEVRCLTR